MDGLIFKPTAVSFLSVFIRIVTCCIFRVILFTYMRNNCQYNRDHITISHHITLPYLFLSPHNVPSNPNIDNAFLKVIKQYTLMTENKNFKVSDTVWVLPSPLSDCDLWEGSLQSRGDRPSLMGLSVKLLVFVLCLV